VAVLTVLIATSLFFIASSFVLQIREKMHFIFQLISLKTNLNWTKIFKFQKSEFLLFNGILKWKNKSLE
jgi:hypothetical protein